MYSKKKFQKQVLIPSIVFMTALSGFFIYAHNTAYNAYEKKDYSSARMYAGMLHWLSDDYINLTFRSNIDEIVDEYISQMKPHNYTVDVRKISFNVYSYIKEKELYKNFFRKKHTKSNKKVISNALELWMIMRQGFFAYQFTTANAASIYEKLQLIKLHNKAFLESVYGGLMIKNLSSSAPWCYDKNSIENSYKNIKELSDKIKQKHLSLWTDSRINKNFYVPGASQGLENVLDALSSNIFKCEIKKEEKWLKKYKEMYVQVYKLCEDTRKYLREEEKEKYLKRYKIEYERYKVKSE